MSSPTSIDWTREGLVIARTAAGDGSHVVGDPCVVWDEQERAWRMFLFFDPPGHASALGRPRTDGQIDWDPPVPLGFTNLSSHGGRTHKPFVVMAAGAVNRAALVDRRYWLVTIGFDPAGGKYVQRAHATSLAGPWTIDADALIPHGEPGRFDEQHVDAVSGYWFEDRQCFLYFYMGYPRHPQPHPTSPFGSVLAAAVQPLGGEVEKLGPVLTPARQAGHWTSGWLGGLQILPGVEHRWVGVLNASPTPPDHAGTLTSQEPAPSLGGLAWTDSEFPTTGWTVASEPFEWVDAIPRSAQDGGEGTNLWRHHVLVAADRAVLLYNSGFYGQEQLYAKSARLTELTGAEQASEQTAGLPHGKDME